MTDEARPPQPRRSRSVWRPVVGVGISAIFLWWALAGLELNEFMEALREARFLWIVPGVLAYFVGVWARTWRWHSMIRHLADVPMRPLFRIVCIGYFGNNVYPLRAGELLRSYVLKREYNVRMSASLATVAIERLFDGLTMLAFVFVALPFVTLEAEGLVKYQPWIVGLTALFLVALVTFLAIANRPQLVRRLATPPAELLGRGWLAIGAGVGDDDLPALRDRLLDFVDRFLMGLDSLARGRDVARIFATSVLVWLAETVKYWFVMHAFEGLAVSFFTLVLMNGVVNLATSLPAGPGHVGTFDGPGIAVLEAAGVGQALATAYTIVLHVALWLPVTALGGWYLWRSHISLRQAQRALAEDSA
jgi:uncharacterized protein (TIRG00374 family)